MASFAILTDSGSDVPESFIRQHPVYVAPLGIAYPEKTYQDGVDITQAEIYRRLPGEIPKTSLPDGQSVHDLVERIQRDGYDQVMVVTISSGLSGTFQMMNLLPEEFPRVKFSFVDTRSIGIGSGMSAMLAAELSQQGVAMDTALTQVTWAAEHSLLLFCIPTLEYLRKGGRIGLVASFLGTTLGLKPVITCNRDGVYETLSRSRGWRHAVDTAVERAVAFAGDSSHGFRVAVAHGNAPQEGKEIFHRIQQSLPEAARFYFSQISPALVVHTGPGLIGIGVQKLAQPL